MGTANGERTGMGIEHLDVLIVGAGLSGVGAACHLQADCPGKSYAILEARGASGGTWDLFRYPGIRSDSDMFTLGYSFRPWKEAKAIADGPSILRYIRDTARENGVEERIRFNRRVVAASWSSAEAQWTVEVECTDTGEAERLTCGFLFGNTGYYRYDEGYTPELPGIESFAGEGIHPQHWPEDLDYTGKRIVVIGSSATAVTLIPALPELSLLAALGRPDRRRAAPRAPRPGRLPDRALEERGAGHARLSAHQARSAADEVADQARRGQPAAARLRRGHALQTHLPALGSEALPGARRGSARVHRGGARVGGDRSHRELHRARRAARLRRGAGGRHRRHRHGAQPAAAGRHETDRRWRGGRPVRDRGLQGDDAQRRAEPRLHGRLHERVVDLEGRSRRGLCLPHAQPHGRARLPDLHAAGTGSLAAHRAVPRSRRRLHEARPRNAAQAGHEHPVAPAPELPARRADAQVRAARGRRDLVLRERGPARRRRAARRLSGGPDGQRAQ